MIRRTGTTIGLVVAFLLGTLTVGVAIGATLPTVNMQPSDTLTVNCPTRLIQNTRTSTRRTFTCRAGTTTATPSPTAAPTPPSGGTNVLVGAGDIGNCSRPEDEATAKLLDGIAGTVFTTGDNAYPDGTASNFSQCYDPNWGRHKARTRPSPGNHDYHTSGASGYFAYFGANAGPSGLGYYAYNIGNWRIYSLNSDDISSAQTTWLRNDLAANPRSCVAAYWHHPRYTSEYANGARGDDAGIEPLWDALADAGAELVLNGHMHHYERMSPIRGVTEVIVGTGGTGIQPFGTLSSNSVARGTSHGVLKITLDAASWSAQFVPIAGQSFTDSFTGSCSGTAAAAPVTAAGPGVVTMG